MSNMSSVKRYVKLQAAVVATLTLAACGGGGGGSNAATTDGPRGIFTSAGDCIESKLFDSDTCRESIAEAIKKHRADAPTYDSERICRGKEQHCERAYTNEYRPRLLAFLLQTKTVGETTRVEAIPLYPPNSTDKGLRDLMGNKYLTTDFTITYSPTAKRALAANPYSGKKRAF